MSSCSSEENVQEDFEQLGIEENSTSNLFYNNIKLKQ
jgi:hypothetical protein